VVTKRHKVLFRAVSSTVGVIFDQSSYQTAELQASISPWGQGISADHMKGQIRRPLVSTKEIHVVGEGCSRRCLWTGDWLCSQGRDGLEGGLKEGEGTFCYWPSYQDLAVNVFVCSGFFHASATVVLSARYAVKSQGVNLISLSRLNSFAPLLVWP
jgi:hypothetical protein